MLILQQNTYDSIFIFDEDDKQICEIKLLAIKSSHTRIGFELDKKYTILREKVLRRKLLGMVRESSDLLADDNYGNKF
jgi:sRNA-binding carbon storage regulator CsrA